jgi:PhzF family phenazine biosynthesis protein
MHLNGGLKANYFEVAAFSEDVFGGNVAAVQVLDYWLDDHLLQLLAEQNKQTETAFIVSVDNIYEIRWFTPVYEINLCGHATLASAYILREVFNITQNPIIFKCKKFGILKVFHEKNLYTLEFPTLRGKKVDIPKNCKHAFGFDPLEAYQSRDMMLVFESEEQILNIIPKPSEFKHWDTLGVICTAKGNEYDFVSRVFDANDYHIEDPVTGSAHALLIPYWSEKLNKKKLLAKQLSKRGGILYCQHLGNTCEISGYAKLYQYGYIDLESLVK